MTRSIPSARAGRRHPLLGPHVGRVEFGVTDRRLEDGGCRAAGLERVVGKRVSGRPNRRGTEQVILELEIRRELPQDPLRDGHHLGPDAVAGQTGDALPVVRLLRRRGAHGRRA